VAAQVVASRAVLSSTEMVILEVILCSKLDWTFFKGPVLLLIVLTVLVKHVTFVGNSLPVGI
jgi:hypothetical protein